MTKKSDAELIKEIAIERFGKQVAEFLKDYKVINNDREVTLKEMQELLKKHGLTSSWNRSLNEHIRKTQES